MHVSNSFIDDLSMQWWDPYGLGDLMLVIIAAVLVIWLIICALVYRDAKSRGMSGILWFIIVLFANIIGIIIYVVLREKKISEREVEQPPSDVPALQKTYQKPPPGTPGNDSYSVRKQHLLPPYIY